MHKWVVAHMGRRDQYQIALALQEVDMLERLVTDMYFPFDTPILSTLYAKCGNKLPFKIRARFQEQLPSAKVVALWPVAVRNALSEKWRNSGDSLGLCAGKIARKMDAGIITYLSCAPAAFTAAGEESHKTLFCFSAHQQSVKEFIEREADRLGIGAETLMREPEVSVSEEQLAQFARAASQANLILAPSRFVANTLIAHGVPARKIALIPYGTNVELFSPRYELPARPLRVLFVGRICFRKGVLHLLEAWRQAGLNNAELVLVGKIDPTAQSWLPRYEGLFRHIPYLAHPALCRLYQRAHILCQPSLAEGFSLTVLEALSCGTPVLTTPNSGAEGVLRPGMDGFVVKAGDITALTERLIYCEKHIDEVMAMRVHARETAEMHTWSHFRQSLIHHLVDFPDARHARGDLSECLLSEGSAYDY